jgi:hypothetical protein
MNSNKIRRALLAAAVALPLSASAEPLALPQKVS